MAKVKSVINSEEKNTGKFMYITSLFFSLPIIMIVFFTEFNAGGWGNLFFALPFLAVVLLLIVIGKFQQNKYDQLGPTPLKLNPSICCIGDVVKGSILISKPNFNKVNELTLSYLRSSKADTGSVSTHKSLWELSITPEVTYIGNETIIEFHFEIPEGKKASGSDFSSNYRFNWEMSFEYVELLDRVKRTWKTPVVYAA